MARARGAGLGRGKPRRASVTTKSFKRKKVMTESTKKRKRSRSKSKSRSRSRSRPRKNRVIGGKRRMQFGYTDEGLADHYWLMSMNDLRGLAKRRGMRNYSKMPKGELIAEIIDEELHHDNPDTLPMDLS